MTDKQLGTTIPLYDTVKMTIYTYFDEMVNAYSKIIGASNKMELKIAVWDFKQRYTKFYMQIAHENKFKKLNKDEQNILKNGMKNIKTLDENKIYNIVQVSRKLIEELGITKIEGKQADSWAI